MSIADSIRSLMYGDAIAIFHQFKKSPYGGGNQFLLALRKELRRQGVRVGARVGGDTKVLLMNSFNFDANVVRRAKKKYPRLRIAHRLAGPIGVYRGTDIEIDRQTQRLNAELADATIFQSRYSADAYEKLGLAFKNPVVIHNSIDPEVFYSQEPSISPKIRLIATAWSDNPKKGGPLLSWLDGHLDHDHYELTFVGRTKAKFKNTHVIEAVPSKKLAEILRGHDIYIAPSEDDPCSNALIEALACGLPVAYLESGGHPELVGNAGAAFHGPVDILQTLDHITENWQSYRSSIRVPTLTEIAAKYLNFLV